MDRVAANVGTTWSPRRSHAFRKFQQVKCVSRGPHTNSPSDHSSLVTRYRRLPHTLFCFPSWTRVTALKLVGPTRR
ncbi:hypothetical protein MTR_3g061520 [Medicago truncatula]|uniref:Uncharacterized protein n=1 Tax=Medicago truncatula TaxID=3880 RepID=G7IYA6_MEDTR|nr:hypothetical protein MTR_3g061520 [Medicago truncatula]